MFFQLNVYVFKPITHYKFIEYAMWNMVNLEQVKAYLRQFNEDKSLKKQITLKFLAVGLAPLLVVSVMAFWLLSSMASGLVTQNLNVLKANKIISIEDYADTIINQVVTASSDPNTADNLIILSRAFSEVFDEAFEQNDTEQYEYDEDVYLDAMRRELSQYYNQEFLPKYQQINESANLDTNSLLSELSNSAVILQHAYIFKNPAPLGSKQELDKSYLESKYDLNHRKIHQTFKPFMENFGYYDIFLVDNKGNVVYSVYKELDFATNLINGPYKDSGLAQAFKSVQNAADPNAYNIIDYAQYTPSYEAPASFIASPVQKYGAQVGVLIFQMPLDSISSVMSERKGLGETAEVYLVGQDGLMRSDSYKSPDLHSVDGSFRSNRKVESDSIEAALKGETGIIESSNYLGEDVLSGYTSLKFGNLTWAMIAEIETSEAFASVTRLVFIITFICIIAIAGIIYFALKVANKIITPIQSMQHAMANIASNTDFSERVEVDREDEIGQTSVSLNKLLDRLKTAIDETNTVVTAMSNGDFSKQVQSDMKGDLLTLKCGVNNSVQAMGESIKNVNKVVQALSHGDFTQQIDANLSGEFETLKTNVNTSIASTRSAMQDITSLIAAMSKGQFSYNIEAQLEGDFADLVDQANTAMMVVNQAIDEIDHVMSQLASGHLDARIDMDLPGQLAQIKDNVNTSIEAVANVFNVTNESLQLISEGKLNSDISEEFPGQFNSLKISTNETLNKLTQVVEEIKNTAVTVDGNSMEIMQGNEELSQRTLQQSSDLDSTAVSMDEIAATVRNTAENAQHANKLANNAKDSAQNGGVVVKDAIAAMSEINDASGKIADIISVIDGIAFQTNLLALNAAVEAARAGEQGRGFAVVAGEVRNLAGRSADAAQQIKHLITDTQEKVDVGSDLVAKSGDTLNQIIDQVEKVNALVADISNAAKEQSEGIQSVHSAMESLKVVTQQNTSMVEEGKSASMSLGNKASEMNELMKFFETKDSAIH